MAPFNPHLPTLDSLATLSADGRTLYLAVINRSEDQDLSATIRISGWKLASDGPVRVFELNGKDKGRGKSLRQFGERQYPREIAPR